LRNYFRANRGRRESGIVHVTVVWELFAVRKSLVGYATSGAVLATSILSQQPFVVHASEYLFPVGMETRILGEISTLLIQLYVKKTKALQPLYFSGSLRSALITLLFRKFEINFDN